MCKEESSTSGAIRPQATHDRDTKTEWIQKRGNIRTEADSYPINLKYKAANAETTQQRQNSRNCHSSALYESWPRKRSWKSELKTLRPRAKKQNPEYPPCRISKVRQQHIKKTSVRRSLATPRKARLTTQMDNSTPVENVPNSTGPDTEGQRGSKPIHRVNHEPHRWTSRAPSMNQMHKKYQRIGGDNRTKKKRHTKRKSQIT